MSRRSLYYQVPEVSDRAWFEPQGDAAVSLRARFEARDDQRRLFIVVNVEAGVFTAHFDLDLRPRTRHEVDVRFESTADVQQCRADVHSK
jgi:hypothetical protein